jgi:membrane associated rhomboid family serine protease
MGIYDRDYYRRDLRNPWGVIGPGGRMVLGLVIANVVMFVIQTVAPEVTPWLILDVGKVLHGEVWRLLTSAFLHAGIWHIVFNMFVLWYFGRPVEELYGPREFLALYLVGALAASAAFCLEQVAWAAASPLGVLSALQFAPQCLGASGAVMAVLIVCAFHYPHRRVMVFFVLPMPAWLMVVLEVVYDALSLVNPEFNIFGIAVSAHLGGAALGFLYYKLNLRWLDLGSWLMFWRRGRPRLRVVADDEPQTPVPVGPAKAADVDEHLEAQVDAVLEKVSRYGQDSLTESEREILFKASEVYRKRRPPN